MIRAPAAAAAASAASTTAEPDGQRCDAPSAVEQVEDEPWAVYLGMVGPNADDEEAEEELAAPLSAAPARLQRR